MQLCSWEGAFQEKSSEDSNALRQPLHPSRLQTCLREGAFSAVINNCYAKTSSIPKYTLIFKKQTTGFCINFPFSPHSTSLPGKSDSRVVSYFPQFSQIVSPFFPSFVQYIPKVPNMVSNISQFPQFSPMPPCILPMYSNLPHIQKNSPMLQNVRTFNFFGTKLTSLGQSNLVTLLAALGPFNNTQQNFPCVFWSLCQHFIHR